MLVSPRPLSLIAAALLAAAATTTSAQNVSRTSTESGLTAIGTAEGFEVLSRAGMGKADYFCAAGDFARSRLGAANTDRVRVIRGLGPSRFEPNRFSVEFKLAGPGGGMFSVGVFGPRPGQNASVGHALALCSRARVNRRATESD